MVMNKQKQRIYHLEREVRRKNLIIHGIKDVKEKKEDLESNVFHLIQDTLSIKLEKLELYFVRRIGVYGDKKNRPIVIGLTAWKRKIDILRSKNGYEVQNIYHR